MSLTSWKMSTSSKSLITRYLFEKKRRQLFDSSASKQQRHLSEDQFVRPSQKSAGLSSGARMNAFGMPVDDSIDIDDILKVSLQENSTETTTVLQNMVPTENASKRENFCLDKLKEINSSMLTKTESGAFLGKRENVLQENEAPRGTIRG